MVVDERLVTYGFSSAFAKVDFFVWFEREAFVGVVAFERASLEFDGDLEAFSAPTGTVWSPFCFYLGVPFQETG